MCKGTVRPGGACGCGHTTATSYRPVTTLFDKPAPQEPVIELTKGEIFEAGGAFYADHMDLFLAGDMPVNGIGWVRDLPNVSYHAYSGISSTRISDVLDTPARAQTVTETTVAMHQGTLLHAATLEPDVFEASIVKQPEGVRRVGKDNLAIWEDWFKAQHALGNLRVSVADAMKAKTNQLHQCFCDSVLYLRDGDRKMIEGVRASLKAPCHTEIQEAMTHEDNLFELSGFGKLPCTEGEWHETRVRTDIIRRKTGVILDLKSCPSAAPHAFMGTIGKRNYHTRGAFYLDLASVIDGKSYDEFIWIAVEKSPPYLMGMYRMHRNSDEYRAGKRRYKHALAVIAECRQTGRWPGYTTFPLDIELNAYALN